jgi:hypothetical protein
MLKVDPKLYQTEKRTNADGFSFEKTDLINEDAAINFNSIFSL